MGATTFVTASYGNSAQEAFNLAVMRAFDSHGSDGYTGTIAEKHSFKIISCPKDISPLDYISNLLEDEDSIASDKWGPALCIVLAEAGKDTLHGKYVFFGWASS